LGSGRHIDVIYRVVGADILSRHTSRIVKVGDATPLILPASVSFQGWLRLTVYPDAMISIADADVLSRHTSRIVKVGDATPLVLPASVSFQSWTRLTAYLNAI
jgi:CRISPR/Cas system CMR subunit Cmr4 (Cas7 group RAMP superfamily)